MAHIACGSLDIPEKENIKAALKRAVAPPVFHVNQAELSKEIIRKELMFLSAKFDGQDAKLFKYLELPSLSKIRLNLFDGSMHGATANYKFLEALSLLTKLENLVSDDQEMPEDVEEESMTASIQSSLRALHAACEEPVENEDAKISALSLASQRCLMVLKDIMSHQQAMPFNLPVDVSVSAEYYRRIKYPLSLSDIRRHLVLGLYGKDYLLTKFYLDVNLVIENALAFNSEISAIGQAALKVSMVFERLFHEMVLCWDTPLPQNDCCHVCRSGDSEAARTILCDRCEATYHIHCLDDSLRNPFDKKAEWYCPACVEQYSVASTHHFRNSHVEHPHSKIMGEVVGLDQVDLGLRFVILFKDGTRECWDVDKVKMYRKGSENDAEVPVINFPPGFVEDDINLVSSIARGYQNWGSLLSPIPTFIDENHIIPANDRDANNPQFSRWQRAIGALGPLSDSEELSGSDWLQILMALSRRNLGSTASLLAPAIASLDVDTTFVPYETKGNALRDISVKSSVQVGDELLFTYESITASAAQSLDEQVPSEELPAEEDVGKVSVHDTESEVEAPSPFRMDGSSSDDLFSENGTVSVSDEESVGGDSSDEDSLFGESFYPNKASSNSVVKRDPAGTWDTRRSSRVKGREDALLTLYLIQEIMSTNWLSGEGMDEEVPDTGLTFGTMALQTAVRACAPRTIDTVDVDEWQRVFEAYLAANHGTVSNCHFCGRIMTFCFLSI